MDNIAIRFIDVYSLDITKRKKVLRSLTEILSSCFSGYSTQVDPVYINKFEGQGLLQLLLYCSDDDEKI